MLNEPLSDYYDFVLQLKKLLLLLRPKDMLVFSLSLSLSLSLPPPREKETGKD